MFAGCKIKVLLNEAEIEGVVQRAKDSQEGMVLDVVDTKGICFQVVIGTKGLREILDENATEIMEQWAYEDMGLHKGIDY